MGIKTRLSEYQIDQSIGDDVMNKLIENGYLKLGEHQDVTPEQAKDIVLASM